MDDKSCKSGFRLNVAVFIAIQMPLAISGFHSSRAVRLPFNMAAARKRSHVSISRFHEYQD